MLPVEYRVTQLKLNHMFNIVHGSAPEYLKNSVNITREPAHNTRSGRFACYIPNVKSFGIKSFFFTGSFCLILGFICSICSRLNHCIVYC